ncbi:L,D-transpeptidase [Spirulina sp. 06S082]|uniref:L,D-transpeptidase n=1 Tax=Spirulina sp. 06S082 TaxID=3110248 RepID=UPI002B204734|nr:L,D-transpeptidase [Spirulina sp. 06S082]MEA5469044.1 L,D-transpeptidase [Spirulina sp. 06S082]
MVKRDRSKRCFYWGLGVSLFLLGLQSPILASPIEAISPAQLTSLLEIPPLGDADKFLPKVAEYRLILRLGDRRVYYYEGEELIVSYPVAIGREGWETPRGNFEVFQKVVNPTWQHPFTGEIVPPSANNPLGVRWIGFWTDGENAIGFHGTPNEELIGQAVSHGCVRMRNTDVIALFEKVEMGTVVIVED